jgi:hypothetical protein
MNNQQLEAIEERYKEVWPTAEKLLALILLVKDVPALAARIRQLEHDIDTVWKIKNLERRRDDTTRIEAADQALDL